MMMHMLELIYIVFSLLFLLYAASDDLPKEKLIQGGTFVNIKNFPHQAYIVLIRPKFDMTYCSGFILDHRWVGTAAHCFEESSNVAYVKVRLGIDDVTQEGAIHDIFMVKIHPKYQLNDTDIALMKTAEPIEFNSNTQPIDLPLSIERADSFSLLFVSGFGRNLSPEKDFNNEFIRMRLKGFNFTLKSPNHCTDQWFGKKSTKYFLCYGGKYNVSGKIELKTPCFGDSGTVIFGKRTNGSRVALAVHKGGNCRKASYGISIPHFVNWIKETMQLN